MTATEAKARILALLDDVEAGEEVEITRHGRIVARLVPASGPHALKGVAENLGAKTIADRCHQAMQASDELLARDARKIAGEIARQLETVAELSRQEASRLSRPERQDDIPDIS